MAQMNVSIPNLMKDWCEAQVQKGRYSTASDYVRDLIRRDQDSQKNTKALQTLIDEGLASGFSSNDLNGILAIAKKKGKTLKSDGS